MNGPHLLTDRYIPQFLLHSFPIPCLFLTHHSCSSSQRPAQEWR